MKKCLRKFGVAFGALLLRGLYASCRKVVIHQKNFDWTLKSGEKTIICIWHGRLLFPFLFFKQMSFAGVAGLHEDADLVSHVGEKLGWKMIRGSSSKEGAKAFQEMIRALNGDRPTIAITPDGPKGPWMKAKAGAVRAAEITNAFVVPVSGQAKRRWEIRNWDVFIVPKPFTKIVIVVGEPFVFEKNQAEKNIVILEEKLNEVQRIADESVQ